jgi:hypothetical protein
LKNFFKNTHANPDLNGGVYFERADYDNYTRGNLTFSDSMTTQPKGLHAVSIVGFGVARHIQYDNDKFGDVPYWHVRNSWGPKWGDKGYFKMAMYPFNKISQFDKEVMTEIGGPVGSMILIRATKRPTQSTLKQIQARFIDNITKSKPTKYYEATADNVRLMNRERLPIGEILLRSTTKPTTNYTFFVVSTAIVVVIVLFYALMSRSPY